MNTEALRSIILFSLLFWASLVVSLVADIYFWDRTMFEFLGDETAKPEIETWMQWSLLAAIAASYAIHVLLWFFIAEKRSRIAKWIYVFLAGLFAVSMALSIEEYATDELAIYGVAALLTIASSCFLFTPEARHWFAGEMQIDPSVFE